MGVCSAVREMALAIDATFGAGDLRVKSAAQALASMPEWATQRRLDLWEAHVLAVLPDEQHHSLAISLIEQVFEFGRFNLYAAFDPDRTADEFRRLMTQLSPLGLVLEERQSVSEW